MSTECRFVTKRDESLRPIGWCRLPETSDVHPKEHAYVAPKLHRRKAEKAVRSAIFTYQNERDYCETRGGIVVVFRTLLAVAMALEAKPAKRSRPAREVPEETVSEKVELIL